MKIFFRLLLAHLLTDFTLQTNFVAKWKRKSFLGVVVHSFTFFIIALILTYQDINKIWFDYPFQLNGLICIFILFILHMIEDEYRAYSVRHYHIKDTVLFFIWDQIIHLIFLYVFSPIRELSFEPWVIILCIFILGTHVLSIIILYFDFLIYGEKIATQHFQKKYFFIIIRLLVMLSFLILPNKIFWLSFIFMPINYLLYKKFKNFTYIGFLINLLTPYLLGFFINNLK